MAIRKNSSIRNEIWMHAQNIQTVVNEYILNIDEYQQYIAMGRR